MQTIEIKIEAFGAIERLLPKALAFEFAKDQMVKDVLSHIINLYPDASPAMEKCACAIGEDIVTRQTALDRSCTLVLLSPVAGG
ncbi:MoaD/ThiS family protein [Acinetobacter dispersus]|uniref:MoaD/ThiS family protein n=1 Tax=Acinetobacter dispersus TaxID=70348 RepID=UPI001F4A6FD1|nr:MoaD/ThiS family protein [Acinetobacter dispersus]MCH7383353.1 MoaD/ThiS family protein [Acinetobacter dispersus]MCH7389755.1 MoaD/ThiS family protein [Acinetobacter dispersus]